VNSPSVVGWLGVVELDIVMKWSAAAPAAGATPTAAALATRRAANTSVIPLRSCVIGQQ
jgi:hypothetical protein